MTAKLSGEFTENVAALALVIVGVIPRFNVRLAEIGTSGSEGKQAVPVGFKRIVE
ncbi:MAG: hypothetical protein IPP88_20150 [Betaproteobacteria bacterium]|nr:hypothetical protein [Betaproteobacteria bacterium]